MCLFIDQSNDVESQSRRRRSTRDEDITSLDFEIDDKSALPTVIEQAPLNVFLTNGHDFTSPATSTSNGDTESESDYDDSSSSSSDMSPKKLILRNSNSNKSQHHHLRHSNHHRNKVQIIKNPHTLRLHVYQHDSHDGRLFLFHKDITLPTNFNSDDTKFAYNKWIQLDLTSIVRTWLQGNEKVLNIDIYCEMCSKYGIYIVNEASQSSSDISSTESKNNPALNVIGAVVRTKRKTQNRRRKNNHGGNSNNNSNNDEAKKNNKQKRTHCRHNGEKKCCRHEWTIDFKELGGYDYIIQPRNFDAGFCEGNCPFRHNMGSNHAYFQSLAHHQLKKDNVPNVCCAPTRLQDLEVLHIDENDNTKLKVTTMKKMLAMKCSCT